MILAVPCSKADAVVLFDTADGTEVGHIAVGSHPVHLAAANGHVLVATMGERSIDVIADGTVKRVPTGVLGPSHVAVHQDRAFVPCTGGDVVAVVDLDELVRSNRVAVGAEPHDTEIVDDRVYVGNRMGGTVTVLDAETTAVCGTIDVKNGAASPPRVQGLAAADGGVYAVDQANCRILRLTETGVVDIASVGADPYEPVVDGDRLFVAGRGDGTVTELSRDLSTTTIHEVGGRPVDVVPTDGRVWVFDRERAVVQSLSGESVNLPYPGFLASVDPERPGKVYVSHYDDDAVSAVDLGDQVVTWTHETLSKPFEPLVV